MRFHSPNGGNPGQEARWDQYHRHLYDMNSYSMTAQPNSNIYIVPNKQ